MALEPPSGEAPLRIPVVMRCVSFLRVKWPCPHTAPPTVFLGFKSYF